MTGISGSTVTPASPPNGHSPMLEICNAAVRLHKRTFGRGPTKSSAHYAGADILVVLLADTMTIAERNLLALGEHERLREQRLFHEHALEDEMRSVVERVLDRRTIAFVPGFDAQHDLAALIFTLEPRLKDATVHGDIIHPYQDRRAAGG